MSTTDTSTNSLIAGLIVSLLSGAGFAQTQLSESDRYIDLETLVLNEPCVQYESTFYKSKWQLVQLEQGLFWDILTGDVIEQTAAACTLIENNSLSPNFVSYDVTDMLIASNGIDTGKTVDVLANADLRTLDLGFNVKQVHDIEGAEPVTLADAGSMAMSGPSSFPFDYQIGDAIDVKITKNFDGTAIYDAATNVFTVNVLDTNADGDYVVVAVFKDPAAGLIDKRAVYSIVFQGGSDAANEAAAANNGTGGTGSGGSESGGSGSGSGGSGSGGSGSGSGGSGSGCSILQVYSTLLNICIDI